MIAWPGRLAAIRARLRLARYWYAVGDLDQAGRDAARAWRLASAAAGAVPAILAADIALTLARIERDRDDDAASRASLEAALRLLEPARGTAAADPLLAWALIGLGDGHRRAGQYPEAADALGRALCLAEDTQAPAGASLRAAALSALGIVAKELGDYDGAARRYGRVAGLHRETGASPGDAATLRHNLAGLAYARGRYAEAESHAQAALRIRRREPGVLNVPGPARGGGAGAAGAGGAGAARGGGAGVAGAGVAGAGGAGAGAAHWHDGTASAATDSAADLAVLAAAVAGQGRNDEARELYGQALAIFRAARPPRRYEIAVQLHGLAGVEHDSGHPAAAEDRYREALALKEELLGPDHPEVGLVAANLGVLLHEQHRDDEAAACWRRAEAIAGAAYPPGHPARAAIRAHLDSLTP